MVAPGDAATGTTDLDTTAATATRAVARLSRLLLLASAASIVLLIASVVLQLGTQLTIAFLTLSVGALVWFALETVSLEREVRRARVRAVDAIDDERQRIQRDLHDSAQQRLVSVRIRLGILARSIDQPAARSTMELLGHELDEALVDIRRVTTENNSQALLANGVAQSLRAVAAHAPLDITVETASFGRYPPRVERAVYFSCLEALQNAVKHAGPRAAVRIRLVGSASRIDFTVEDSGVGFDPARVQPGAGLVNLTDRVAVTGGHLTIDSHPGLGTRISGEIPIDRDAAA